MVWVKNVAIYLCPNIIILCTHIDITTTNRRCGEVTLNAGVYYMFPGSFWWTNFRFYDYVHNIILYDAIITLRFGSKSEWSKTLLDGRKKKTMLRCTITNTFNASFVQCLNDCYRRRGEDKARKLGPADFTRCIYYIMYSHRRRYFCDISYKKSRGYYGL